MKPTEVENFFEIPKIEYYYGDKKELPVCLMREIHENMFYWLAHLHPNQKYETDKFDQSRIATEVAVKHLQAYADQQVNRVLGDAIDNFEKVQGSWSYAQVISLLESLKIKQP